MKSLLRTLLLSASSLLLSTTALAQDAAPLQFSITEGRVENAFYQHGAVAAHLLLSSGEAPRVLVAFPAGNSGAGVWFENASTPVQWTLDDVRRGRTMRRAVHARHRRPRQAAPRNDWW